MSFCVSSNCKSIATAEVVAYCRRKGQGNSSLLIEVSMTIVYIAQTFHHKPGIHKHLQHAWTPTHPHLITHSHTPQHTHTLTHSLTHTPTHIHTLTHSHTHIYMNIYTFILWYKHTVGANLYSLHISVSSLTCTYIYLCRHSENEHACT